MIRYPTITGCLEDLFPYIRKRMIESEPAPKYEAESIGLDRLSGIFALMEHDEYDSVLRKAAYLFCSVVDGHCFSNGNKRLGVTLLLYFLLSNGYAVSIANMDVVRSELRRIFPNLHWENVEGFRYPHEYFFYHLALIIADRKQKGEMTFSQEQHAVMELLGAVMVNTNED